MNDRQSGKQELLQLIKEFEEVESKREDLNLPLNALTMQDNGRLKNYTYGEFDVSEVANKRLTSMYGFSKSHFDVLAEQGHFDLIAEQFNRMMLKDHRVMKFRCIEDRIKGIVNKDYRKYDDHDVFSQVSDYMDNNGFDYDLEVLNLDDDFTRMRFMIKDTEKNFGMAYEGQLDNDIVKAGFEITNSELGEKGMGINSLIYRQICTNGMMQLLAEDSEQVFNKRGRQFNPYAQQTLLHNGLENSIEKASNGIYTFRKTKDILVEDPIDEIEKIGSRYKLGRGNIEAIQGNFEHESQFNMYGILNSITRTGQSFGKRDYKNRSKFETIANDILEKVS